MQERALGRSGLVISRLALGTMMWGQETDKDSAAAQLSAFRDAGGTLVDTADMYSGGASQSILGSLLGGVVPRSELLLSSKAGGQGPLGGIDRGSSRGHLLSALDDSLRRLGTDYLDLWQVDSWQEPVPLEETLSALDYAVTSGKARYVGLSNFSGWQTAKAAVWQRSWPTRSPIVSNQVEYSLLERGIEREVVPACHDAGIGILAWSPLGRGVLSGRYRHSFPADSRATLPQRQPFVGRFLTDEAKRVVEAVITAAEGLGTSPAAVALAWVRDRPGVTALVIGPRTINQLTTLVSTEDITLPAEITAALDDVSSPPLGYPERRPG